MIVMIAFIDNLTLNSCRFAGFVSDFVYLLLCSMLVSFCVLGLVVSRSVYFDLFSVCCYNYPGSVNNGVLFD